jgi:hypothetical protein
MDTTVGVGEIHESITDAGRPELPPRDPAPKPITKTMMLAD